MYYTKVFDLNVVLDWMMDPKVDSRRDGERLLAVVHNDTDRIFSERGLFRQ